MLRFEMNVKPNSRSSRGSAWIAACQIDGMAYEAESRSGASCALARKLVEAGVADQPVEVFSSDGVKFSWPSLHKAAASTFSEGATSSLRRAKYVAFSRGDDAE